LPARERRCRICSPEEASRGGAGPGSEPVPVGEAGDVADVGEDPGGAGGADPEEVHQCAAGRGDVLAQSADELLEFAVECERSGNSPGVGIK